MKPKLNVTSAWRLSHYDRPADDGVSFPPVEFGFQIGDFGGANGGGGWPRRRPGFTSLAREVLRADASRSFRLETTVLGFITLVAAWPIAVMIHEVIRLLK